MISNRRRIDAPSSIAKSCLVSRGFLTANLFSGGTLLDTIGTSTIFGLLLVIVSRGRLLHCRWTQLGECLELSSLLLRPDASDAQVLALHQTLQMPECLLELLEYLRRAMAVTSRVILRVHWIDNHELGSALWGLRIERP